MAADFVSELYRPVSRVRLESYRLPGASDKDMIVAYLWNMALAEALAPTLAALEVALRNAIHDSLTSYYGTEFWFDQSAVFPPVGSAPSVQAAAVRKARSSLRALARSPTAARIVAELTFGFWTKMLSRSHNAVWLANRGAALKAAFPYAQGPDLQRHLLHQRYDSIRLLRNRVFHHEPVWHRGDLFNEHTAILEAIGWISPALRDAVAILDRFPLIFRDERTRIEAALKDRLGVA